MTPLRARLWALAFVLAARGAAAQGSPGDKVQAQALYDEARGLMGSGNYAEACPKLEESNRLDTGVGTKFYLADCWEKLGRTASAWALYLEVADETRAAGQVDRSGFAQSRAQSLAARLSKLAVKPEGPPPDGLQIERDGAVVSRAAWGSLVPVDLGEHRVRATAPGKKPWETTVTVASEGAAETVTVPPLEDAPVEIAPVVAPVGPDRVAPAETQDLSHTGQLGVTVRADIDGQFRGAIGAVGVGYGLASFLDVGVAALLGSQMGAEPAVTVYLLEGELKPLVTLAAPLFFIDGAKPGVRAAAGVEWDPSRTVGVFAQLGAAWFPGLPGEFDSLIFVPTVGAMGRL